MRRTLNVKFLLCLVAGLAVTSGGVALAHHLQCRRIPLALLKQAQKAEDENDLKRADDYLTRYLDFAPGDVEQKARLARMITDKKTAKSGRIDYARAFFLLQDVLADNPNQPDLQKLFVTVAIPMGRLENAEAVLKELPRDAETIALWGRLHEAREETPQAIECFREAVKLEPGDVDRVKRFVRLLRERTWERLPAEQRARKHAADVKEADAAIDAMVKADPNSWKARLARWNYNREFYLVELRGQKRNAFAEMIRGCLLAEAGADVVKALELREGEADVRLAASELARLEASIDLPDNAAEAQTKLATAREHLDKALQLHNKDPRLFKAYASVELLAEERAEKKEDKEAARERALNRLRTGAAEMRTPAAQFDVLWALATVLLDTTPAAGEEPARGSTTSPAVEEAEKTIARLRTLNLQPAGVDYLQGRLMMKRQQWAEAATLLERAQPLLAEAHALADEIDLQLAHCYDELNQPQQRYDVYKRLLARNPESMQARRWLAHAARALGKLDEALRLYGDASQGSDLPPGLWADRLRLEIVKAIQDRRESSWQRIDKACAEARERHQADDVEIAVLEAESWYARGNTDRAREVLTAAQKKFPDRAECWGALAALAERTGDPDQALRLLDEADAAVKEPGQKIELRLARASHWANQRGPKAKEELLKLSKDLERFDREPANRNRLRQGLAEANYRAGNYQEAGRLWQELAQQKEYRADLRLRLVLFDLALQEDDEAGMTAVLEELRAIEGKEGTFTRHAEALQLVWSVRKNKVPESRRNDSLDQAARLLNLVKSARPTWSAALLGLAEIETLRGNPDLAVQAYRDALALGDRSPLVYRQLTELLRKQGKFDEARKVLGQLTREDLVRTDLTRTAAVLAFHTNNMDEAIDRALGSVRGDSRNWRDHLWLGQLVAVTGRKPELAEEHLRRATQLEPAEAEPWVALVRFLVGLKDEKKKAEATGLLGVIATTVRPAEASLALAQCNALLERGEEALKHYQAALKTRPKDAALLADFATFRLQRNELKEAEELLRRSLADDVEKSTEEAEWAHGRLALVLSADEDYGRFKEAQPHVGLRLDGDQIVRDNSLVRGESVGIRRVAARVLAARGTWLCRGEAIKRLEDLDQRQLLGADDRFILARLYEARGDWSQAQRQFNLLAVARDRRPEHLVALAQGLLSNGQPDSAQVVIQKLEAMHKEHPLPGGDVMLLELRARWYEARRQGDKAIALLRERVNRPSAEPNEVLLLVASYGRQKRFNEALGLIEPIWKRCTAEMAGGTCVALLRSARATDQQRKQVEGYLREALKKEPKNVNLLVQLGDVLDLGNSFAEAEEVYRQALKIAPNNMLALNNLAWLLALRTQKGEEALELINRAIESAGPRGELLDTRSLVHLALGKPADGEADLQLSLKESPSAAKQFHLARLLLASNKRDAAKRAFKAANELGLEPSQLHPVEQVAHRKVQEDLNR